MRLTHSTGKQTLSYSLLLRFFASNAIAWPSDYPQLRTQDALDRNANNLADMASIDSQRDGDILYALVLPCTGYPTPT